MILASSILVGTLVAALAYRVLFYDRADFFAGCLKFAVLLPRKDRRLFYRSKPLTAQDFEDDGWSSGIRFFLFLAFSVGSGFVAYNKFHAYFGP